MRSIAGQFVPLDLGLLWDSISSTWGAFSQSRLPHPSLAYFLADPWKDLSYLQPTFEVPDGGGGLWFHFEVCMYFINGQKAIIMAWLTLVCTN